MAFPGTFNISYYKGDTYEFKIYPKDASGAAYPLDADYLVAFTISPYRGADGIADKIEAYAVISEDFTNISCAILPENGNSMLSGVNYVYDVEINKTSLPYNIVRTLLTGTITVTDQITGAQAPEEPVEEVS
jgi:hypothetical protein